MKNKNQNMLYTENLELFACQCPLEAYRLERGDCEGMSFCHTQQGELNLVDRSSGQSIDYLHSQEGAAWEAQLWAETLPLVKNEVIFVYGIGLGYYYVPLREWLKNPQHQLVFVEDDPRVLQHFLQTPLAAEILNHSQVEVKLMPFLRKRSTMSFDDFWSDIRRNESFFFHSFMYTPFFVSALQSYFFNRMEFFNEFITQWNVTLSIINDTLSEVSADPNPIFANYYANLPYHTESGRADELFGAFEGRPAILCGAGPSLTKQLNTLGSLTDHALILASGSAMTAVTGANIMPHVCGGIDPNAAQASRLLNGFIYEVPIFYESRYYNPVLAHWHGPRLFTQGGIEVFRIQEWFEGMLKTKNDPEILGVMSTSNFLSEMAGYLGCDPIILLGMDLAYTGGLRYAEGVVAHVTDKKSIHEGLIQKEESILEVSSADGGRVYTRYEWLMEAVNMMDFQKRHPHVTFLNATEGGMPIENVPNIAFKKVIEEHLQESWDFQGWLHGTIQNTAKEKIIFAEILRVIEIWRHSLEKCVSLLNALILDLEGNQRRFKEGNALPFGPYSGRCSLWQVELHEEIAYEYLLEAFEAWFRIKHHRKSNIPIEFEIELCNFLRRHATSHLDYIQAGLEMYETRVKELSSHGPMEIVSLSSLGLPEYRKREKRIQICEPELKLDLQAVFDPVLVPTSQWPQSNQQPCIDALICQKGNISEGQALYFYSSGAVKAEVFYHRGKLHGPWTFFNERGILLARSWFIQGQRQGKSCYYYNDGSLYSVQGYRDGKAQGQHLFYYPDGTLKTRANYVDGLREGLLQLYFANGQLQKEQHFKHGQLHGKERMWNEAGQQILDVTYN